MMMYFSVVCRVSFYKMQERPPRMNFSVMLSAPAAMAFMTYRGEVPISPYTIPNVISKPAAEIVEIWLWWKWRFI